MEDGDLPFPLVVVACSRVNSKGAFSGGRSGADTSVELLQVLLSLECLLTRRV